MKKLYLLDDAIISPLGFSTAKNLKAVKEGKSGLRLHKVGKKNSPEFFTGIVDKHLLAEKFRESGDPENFTKLEQMMILAVQEVLQKNPGLKLSETGLVISTTKGNINLLHSTSAIPQSRLHLSGLAKVIAEFFGFPNKPVVLSNACISGGLAIAVSKRLINTGRYKNAIVVGGDLVSEFVLSGFNAFQALSNECCKPFSRDRGGINIGEAAAALLVSRKKPQDLPKISLIGEASTNDANHISGPSRTGEGLFKSIKRALKNSGIAAEEIGFLSAHGTATAYNDEMEAVAFHRAGLQNVPVNSLKAYFGHTLGASALVESIITRHSLINNELYLSLGFAESGVSKPLNIIKTFRKEKLTYALKTASGFGGCNLALVFQKEMH